jgi:CRISPR-associated protein Csm3
LRSLLEWALGKIEDDGKVWGSSSSRVEEGDEILRIFGTTRDDWKEGPARALFRDLMLEEEWKRSIDERGLPLTEEKTEVAINRIEGKADQMGPRTMERIPAGARFCFEILFREFSVNGDGGRRDRECLNRLLEAFRLLEQDALGGSGSRGYGKVEVERVEVNESDVTTRFRQYSQFKRETAHDFVQNG